MNKEKSTLSIIIIISIIIVMTSMNISSTMLDPIRYKETPLNDQPFIHDLFIEMIHEVNESKLYEYINTISGYGPRPTGSETLDEVIDYIYEVFLTLDINVSIDQWKSNAYQGKNIVATLPGKTNKKVIVTAHADTITVSPGADDDASGIASILMIAEIMSTNTYNATIHFIIFTGEENGVLGSMDFAKKAYRKNNDIIAVLSLDKIGYAQTQDDGRRIRHHANRASDWMIDISKDIATTYYDYIGLDVIELPFDGSSDHRAFISYGFAGSNLVEDALNPFYHTSEDTIKYINTSYLSKVTCLALGIISKIACLNPILQKDDLHIQIQGSHLSKPSQLNITIFNTKYDKKIAHVKITIQLKHIIRDIYVRSKKEYYNDPCIWNITSNITEAWEFHLGPRIFTQGLCTIEVIIRGIKDDISLYKEQIKNGIILYPNRIILFPC